MALISDFLTNQDPNDNNSIFNVIGVHNEYLNYYKRWQFLIRSYMGGHSYRMGQYLTRYVYESDNEYLKRLTVTPLENHVKAITHIYNSYLFRNPPKRNLMSFFLFILFCSCPHSTGPPRRSGGHGPVASTVS